MITLLSEEQLQTGVARMAEELRLHYGQRAVTVIGVLSGCVVLLADLIRRLDMPLRVGFVQASSYRGQATSPEGLALDLSTLPDIRGQHVLLVDDIFDTGGTLAALVERLRPLELASLRSAVLLRKQGRQTVACRPDHVAFEIPDLFVVGYGLDFDGLYRNLPYVAALEPHDLTARQ